MKIQNIKKKKKKNKNKKKKKLKKIKKKKKKKKKNVCCLQWTAFSQYYKTEMSSRELENNYTYRNCRKREIP